MGTADRRAGIRPGLRLRPSLHRAGRSRALADRVRRRVETVLADFPWEVRFHDWLGHDFRVGGDAPHWRGLPLEVALKTESAGRTLLAYDAMGFLEKVLAGEADLDGNLYLLSHVRAHARFELGVFAALRFLLRHRRFQDTKRARLNVRSHYDIPQDALDVYLDRKYRAYSCGMFDQPQRLELAELLRVGEGEDDAFDSLEKAQWRKFKDAIDYIAPEDGDRVLDVGCGYGGQLLVALESHRFAKYVGWTHSANQMREGSKLLARFDPERWEINEGDYRQDDRVFDHVTSTGMISHVGPRGLAPYLRNVRQRIKTGGRYLHHCLMRVWSPMPLDFQLGPVFHKRFVWPGFHWFTLGDHLRALERNGFEVRGLVNLSPHYVKTGAAWYERMMEQRELMIARLGEPTFRAWRLFLAGAAGDMANHGIHVYRIYCEAI